MESAEADLKKSEVSVKGVYDPEKLVEFVLKRTGKHAVVVKVEAAEKAAEEEGKAAEEEKKASEEGEKKEEKEEEAKRDDNKAAEEKKDGEAAAAVEGTVTEETKVVEMKVSEYQYYPPTYIREMYAYPPQIFSDENPNACSIM